MHWFISIGIVVCLGALLVLRHTFLVIAVEGSSMEPALTSGQNVLFRRQTGRLRVGDIVAIRMPLDHSFPSELPLTARPGDSWLIKRVVALESAPIPARIPHNDSEVVPIGSLVVQGDSMMSLDSRTWGCIPISRVSGIAIRVMSVRR